jgi:hypothetical protein
MEKFAADTSNSFHGLVIRTDNRWKQFKYGGEVPKKVMRSQFDYLEDGENQDGFFRFHRTWYHTSEFMAMHGSGLENDWDGAKNESMSQGVLLKISKDGEEYIVGTYYSANRDHWNELQAKKMHQNPDDEHKHPFVVIEVDRKPVEVTIINPNDYDWARELFLFSFGAYGDDLMLVFANGVEKALEIAASDLLAHSPGSFVDQEEMKQLYDEALEESSSEEETQEKATVDLTYTESGYIPSWEWGVNDATPLLVKEAKAASKAFMEDPDEPFMRMNPRGTPPRLPPDLTKLTQAQHEASIQWLSQLPLKELRHRQDLNNQQTEQAYRQGNEDAIKDLRVMERHYQAAIDMKEFGKNPGDHISHGFYRVSDAEAAELSRAAGQGLPPTGQELRVGLDSGKTAWLSRTPTDALGKLFPSKKYPARGWVWAISDIK